MCGLRKGVCGNTMPHRNAAAHRYRVPNLSTWKYGCRRRRGLTGRGRGAVQIDMYGLADRIFQGREIPLRRPLFEFGIAMRIGVDDQGLAAILHRDFLDDLGVAAIEAFGDADEGGEELDALAQAVGERAVIAVALLRRRLAMVARDQRDHVDLLRIEAAEIAVANQVVRVLVMALVGDVHADVMEQRA